MPAYLRVRWKHASADTPTWLYSELDDDRRETRKVEAYADGRQGYADGSEEFGETWLGIVPVPELAQIALDSAFEPELITEDEFERIWSNRKGRFTVVV